MKQAVVQAVKKALPVQQVETVKRIARGAGSVVVRTADVLFFLFVFPAGLLLKTVRKWGVQRMPLCRKALLTVGVFPIRNHYYDPQFKLDISEEEGKSDRKLPGIDWNVDGQLKTLEGFTFAQELADVPLQKRRELEYFVNNGAFESGDGEFFYQLVRSVKPKRIFEIGSGSSTLMAQKAVKKNLEDDSGYTCKHVCIEPYEMPWLEKTGIPVIRKRVEEIDLSLFSELSANDILFIDSSHMIRPSGDVLAEYLEILPTLSAGVIVHIHDIFSPRNYPKQWLQHEIRFWNEQYLLEAFLSENTKWKVLLAVNYLHHHYPEEFKTVAPTITTDREPGSFYIQKVL